MGRLLGAAVPRAGLPGSLPAPRRADSVALGGSPLVGQTVAGERQKSVLQRELARCPWR